MELAYLCRLRKIEVLAFSRLKDLTSGRLRPSRYALSDADCHLE
jgi:hypothetical protein